MEKLEQITSEAKSRMQELTVTDYSRVACGLIEGQSRKIVIQQ